MTSDNDKHLFRELLHVRGSFERNKTFPYWQGLKAGNEDTADNIWPHEFSMKDFFRENWVDTKNPSWEPRPAINAQTALSFWSRRLELILTKI